MCVGETILIYLSYMYCIKNEKKCFAALELAFIPDKHDLRVVYTTLTPTLLKQKDSS